VSRSRLELARAEVDRVFGQGYAAAHPQMVLAVMNTAATDWAARVTTAGLQDIAVALVEGSGDWQLWPRGVATQHRAAVKNMLADQNKMGPVPTPFPLVNGGMSRRKAAKVLGVSPRTIRPRCRQNVARPRFRTPQDT